MSTIILVTGATKGIRRGFVEHYLRRQNTTVIAGVRSPSSTEATRLCLLDAAPGSKAILVKIDATSGKDACEAMQELQEKYGIKRLDIVIANAGIFYATANQKVLDMKLLDLQLFQATWNLLERSEKPIFLLNSAALASIGGMKAFVHLPLHSYAASKMLANFFITRIHFEHPSLISFAVHPGSVATENRTAAAVRLGASVEGISVDQCVLSLLSLVSIRNQDIINIPPILTAHKVDRATLANTSGTFVNVDGIPIPW